MKNTKKTKAKFVVDLTDVESPIDIKLCFIEAKALNGIKLTQEEFNFAIYYGMNIAINSIDTALASINLVTIEDDELCEKLIKEIAKKVCPKKPWYKRFWNWVKKPFTKKK